MVIVRHRQVCRLLMLEVLRCDLMVSSDHHVCCDLNVDRGEVVSSVVESGTHVGLVRHF